MIIDKPSSIKATARSSSSASPSSCSCCLPAARAGCASTQVLHTGNRIDAMLGSQVFRHLLRLPLPYFEHRPTGTLVARLHGVETIREFVSSAAVTLVLDFPFLLVFLAVMFAYSWQLSLIAVGLLGLIALISLLVAPVFRDKLNRQFMLGARNQSFLTEYVCGMATVKSLQMEPDIDKQYGELLAQYLAAGTGTSSHRHLQRIANGLERVMTLSILIVGALLVMGNEGFTVRHAGRFPDVRQPHE
ncbi:ABC transporter transmembrane domain-containing protein, partial [Propionivibrio sp.]|uniref:ABC transporter transmembrane domain-containing protein n=1 Tax=Propionivibrio sp. TaxID=2212460 RepID=UPI0025DEB9E1